MRSWGAAVLSILCLLGLGGCRSPQQRAANAAARADYYATNGDFRAASIEMSRAVRFDEDQPAYWLAMAHYDLRLGDVRGAYAAYQHVYELQRDNVEALEWLSELSVAGNDLSSARTYLDSLMVLQPNDLRGRIAQGEIAMKSDHYDEALKIADGVLHDDPTAGDAAVLKSSALEKLGRSADAAGVLEARVGDSGPGSLSILQKLVDLYTEVGDRAGLVRTYQRMLKLDPASAETGLKLAGALVAGGDRAAALSTVRDVQARHPTDGATQIAALGLLRAILGQAAARAEALRLAQAVPAVRGAVASFLVDDGAPAAARDLVSAVAGQPVSGGNVEAQVAYASALRALGQAGQARMVLDRVIAFDSTNERALLLRASIELAAHDLDRALADARVAVDASPQTPDPQLLLAQVYTARNNDLLTRSTYATALNAFPADERVLGAFVGYLAQAHALGQAYAVTDSFTRANPRSLGGWAIRRQVCSAARDQGCVRQATAVLSGHAPRPADGDAGEAA